MEQTYTAKQLAETTGKSTRWIMKLAKKENWQSLPESCRDKGYDILLIVNRGRELLARTPRNEKTPQLKAYAASINYDHRSLYRYLKRANKALKAAQFEVTKTFSVG